MRNYSLRNIISYQCENVLVQCYVSSSEKYQTSYLTGSVYLDLGYQIWPVHGGRFSESSFLKINPSCLLITVYKVKTPQIFQKELCV